MPPVSPHMHVQPGPMTTACGVMPDGTIVLRIEHATGSTMLPMDVEFAKGLINQLQQVTGGLVVPTLAPVPV